MSAAEAQDLVASVRRWHHKFELAPGVWTPGAYDPRELLDRLDLPKALAHRTVLDIGTCDGFFALALKKRGATVTCVDYRSRDVSGFGVMEKITGHAFDYRQTNVYELGAERLGQFDIVLFLGVLYHLPDMFRGLRIVRSLCRDRMFLETHSEENGSLEASARYCAGKSLNNDVTNFWAPNERCVLDMLADVGFSVTRKVNRSNRLFVECEPATIPLKAQIGYSKRRVEPAGPDDVDSHPSG
jgi:tRNA (mo5U34)-methyltransferase